MPTDNTRPGLTMDNSPDGNAPQHLIDLPTDSLVNLRELAFHCMQDGFVILDTRGVHLDVNAAFCAMTGFSAQELIGCGAPHPYWPEEETAHIQAALARTLNGEFAEIELVFKRRSGERFPVLVNPFAIRDQRGSIASFAATVKEIPRRVAIEKALQASESRYRALFDNAGDAIMILKDGQVVDFNAQTLINTGRTREEMLNHPTADYFPPTQPNGQDSREFFTQKVVASYTEGPQRFEWTGTIAGGVLTHTDVTMTSFQVGAERYVMSIVRDITQRKALEASLKRKEEQYRSLFEHAGDGIFIMHGTRILDCNQRALDIYGITREQIAQRPDFSLSPPLQPNGQDSQAFLAEKVAALRAGEPQTFLWTGTRFDGAPVQTEVVLTSLTLDGKACTQLLIRDITQRQVMESALRDSEVRYRTLFENAGDAIAIHKNSRTIDCNDRLSEIYGFSREEILGATMGDFFPPFQPNGQDSREFFREREREARAGTPQIYEWHGRRRDGSPVITEITLTSFTIGGEIYEQAIGRDITQRKRMEENLRDLNRTLEERVAQRTEELEKTCSELLQRNAQFRALASRLTQAENEERRRIAQVLHDNHQQLIVAAKFRVELLRGATCGEQVDEVGRQVLEILDQALDVSRSLTMELAPPILYGAGLVAALQWLAHWMQESYQLEVAVVGSLPMTRLPTDVSDLLFQGARELLLNVVKHAGVRRATVSVTLEDNQLLLSVADEGAGFNSDAVLAMPRSFGLFSIRERLVPLGGRLIIDSQPGCGTVGSLAIPVLACEEPDAAYADEPEGVAEQDGAAQLARRRPVRILVTDDHDASRASLTQILQSVPEFEIVGQAVDGQDAIEKTRLLHPDLILMDISMPRLDGVEATRRITREFPQVKVIGLSMNSREEMQPRMRAAGASTYLHKSTSMDDLIDAIRVAMHRDTAHAAPGDGRHS